MNHYNHLTILERENIFRFSEQSSSSRMIAEKLESSFHHQQGTSPKQEEYRLLPLKGPNPLRDVAGELWQETHPCG